MHSSRIRTLVIAAAAALVLSVPVQAQEPNAYPITNVNLRAGPGTEYPIVFTVPTEAPITILGCLADYTWCDTVFENYRGWMSAVYLAGYYEGQYYYLKDWAPDLDYQVVTFNVETYWDTYYQDQPFYAQRTRWLEPQAEGYVDNAVFYDRLSPHGSWTWTQGQYVWVPAGVDRGWRPYTRGRWVYTDVGWTWASEEPFGWATYHYGRWGYSDRMGWFWVPGNRWAPAWVAWRQDDDYLGWAPLPPTYDRGGIAININIGNVPDYYWSVVPSRDFLAADLDAYYVHDRRPFFEQSRPIGHTTIVNNNTVVNNVVNVEYVEEKTNTEIVEKTIQKTKNINAAGRTDGDALEVYDPALDDKPVRGAPREPKKVEEVAGISETKGQAGGAASTEDMLTPPEVEQALKERKSSKARRDGASDEVIGTRELDPSLPKGAESDSPPPGSGKKKSRGKPAVAAEELGPKPDGTARGRGGPTKGVSDSDTESAGGPGGRGGLPPGKPPQADSEGPKGANKPGSKAARGLSGGPKGNEGPGPKASRGSGPFVNGEDRTISEEAPSVSSESAGEDGPGGRGGLPPGKPPQADSEGPKGANKPGSKARVLSGGPEGKESPGPKAAREGAPFVGGPKGKESPGQKAAGDQGPRGKESLGQKAPRDSGPQGDEPKVKEGPPAQSAGGGAPKAHKSKKTKGGPGPKEAGGGGPKFKDGPPAQAADGGGPKTDKPKKMKEGPGPKEAGGDGSKVKEGPSKAAGGGGPKPNRPKKEGNGPREAGGDGPKVNEGPREKQAGGEPQKKKGKQAKGKPEKETN